MCGICGIYGLEDKDLIKKMLYTIEHRGPDDRGVYLNSNISMGHSRLSIIDLSKRGKQPLTNENGDVWLSVNGEIYNFHNLRSTLEKKGHLFHSNSDSEVIVHTYEEYGLNFIKYLRGMFALAIYDENKNIIILARDRIGKKPLYYYYDEKVLIFASEIKAILETEIPRKIDRYALYSYLTYNYTLGKKTLFEGVKKILPGEMLIYDGHTIKIKRYWDLKENIKQKDEKYYRKNLRELLEESVKLRMIADVPIGAFLSGGIDSSAVVALARPHIENFHTFSVGFDTFSELEYAQIVSDHLDTIHHEIIVTDDNVRKDIEKIAWYYDEPMGDAAIINNYYMGLEASKLVKVVLAGEGGDELFGGYDYYNRNIKNILNKTPTKFKYLLKNSIRVLPRGDITSFSNNLHRLLDFYLCQPNLEETHLQSTRIMSNDEINYILSTPIQKPSNMVIKSSNKIKEDLNKMLALDCKNLLPEKFLMKADKAIMANSVEERLPLLDQKIIEFAFKIPPKFKIFKNEEKYILRQAVKDILPQKIIQRKKQGFGTPVNNWLNGSLNDLCFELLEQGKLINEIIEKNTIHKYLNNLNNGKINNRLSTILWALISLEIWHRIYFKQ